MTKVDRLIKWKRNNFFPDQASAFRKIFFKYFRANDILAGLILLLRNILFTDFQKVIYITYNFQCFFLLQFCDSRRMVKEGFDKNGLLCSMIIVEVTIFLRVYQQGIQSSGVESRSHPKHKISNAFF